MLSLHREMQIAIVASIWISVPPKGFGFGAQEYLAYYIAEGLKRKAIPFRDGVSGDGPQVYCHSSLN